MLHSLLLGQVVQWVHGYPVVRGRQLYQLYQVLLVVPKSIQSIYTIFTKNCHTLTDIHYSQEIQEGRVVQCCQYLPKAEVYSSVYENVSTNSWLTHRWSTSSILARDTNISFRSRITGRSYLSLSSLWSRSACPSRDTRYSILSSGARCTCWRQTVRLMLHE